MMAGRAGQRGFALLIVLWSLVLITLLVTQLNSAGRSETRLAGSFRLRAEMEAAADGGVHAAIFHLMDVSPQGIGQAWRPADAVRRLRDGDVEVVVGITDEAGKVNPSTASPELLQALAQAVGVDAGTAARVATAIVTWRTPFGATGASNPRFDAYRAAGRAVGPSGAPFQSLTEVGAVLGVTPDLLARLAPHLSLFAEGDPDPAQADPVVRQALAAASGGNLPPGGGREASVRVVTIEASAHGRDGGNFIRRAVVRIAMNGAVPDYRILSWEAPVASER